MFLIVIIISEYPQEIVFEKILNEESIDVLNCFKLISVFLTQLLLMFVQKMDHPLNYGI